MKITIFSENLQKKLPLVYKAISSKSQLPILLNFLLETDGNTLSVKATDLEIGINVIIPAVVEKPGKISVSAKLFYDVCMSLPQDKIHCEVVGGSLIVTSKKTKTLFPITPPDEFPNLYEEKGEEIAKLKGKELKKEFTAIVFSASLDVSRPNLSGVLIQKEKDSFLYVATDGYRLSFRKKPITSTSDTEEKLLIPSRVFREVMAIKTDEEDMKLFVSKINNQVLFSSQTIEIVGRLIDARFPPFQKIIPQDHATSFLFDKEELQKAVKICSIFARDTANIIKISLKKDYMIVSANTPSIGENTVEVEGKLTGEENEIAFNSRYLSDLCANIDAKEMEFEMTGPLNPGVFKINGDPNFLHLIMPIRIQE